MKDDRAQFEADIAEFKGDPLIEPTAEEARNGWTAADLTKYLADQKAAANVRINPSSAMRGNKRPQVANSRYNPLKWQR